MNGGKDMSVHHEPAQSVVQAFRSDVKNGLDERKVQENRQRYDENKLKEKKKKDEFAEICGAVQRCDDPDLDRGGSDLFYDRLYRRKAGEVF